MTRWQRFCCWMDWHKPGKVGFDGCSMNSYCIRCGERVLHDSQGNWFGVEQHKKKWRKGQ